MRIFLTYIIKSMLEKKSRLILILTAIVLSSGLLIGSLAMVEVGAEVLVKSQREVSENKDIRIYSDKGNGSFKLNQIKEEGVKNLLPQILYNVTYGEKNEMHITMYGREKEYIEQDILLNKETLNKLKNKACIISLRAAEDHHLQVGDQIEVKINNAKIKLEIVGLAGAEGIFYGDKENSFVMLVDYDFLAQQLGMSGKYNAVMANKTEDTINASIQKFKAANTKLRAMQIYSDYNDYAEQMVMPLYFMLVIIICMSIMIIYSSFKLMITERLAIIGTFLSQGATKGTVKSILYLESILYGLVGGSGGVLLGVLITMLTTYFMSPLREYGIIEKANINEMYLLIGLLFAVFLAFISAIIPIKQINQLQVKALILKQTKEDKGFKWQKCLIGVILTVVSYFLNNLQGEVASYLSPITYLISIIGVMMAFPAVLVVISTFLFNLIKRKYPVFGIALNNVGTSKVLIDNIKLMFFAMLVVVTIQSASTGVLSHITAAYEELIYDLNVGLPADKAKAESIRKLIKSDPDVIDATYQEAYEYEGKINDESFNVMGVDAERYQDYNHYFDWEIYGEVYERFKKGNEHSAIISTQVAKATGLKEGDYFELEIDEKKVGFEVTGLIDGKLYWGNVFIILKNEAIKGLYHFKVPNGLTCRTRVAGEIVKARVEQEINEKGGRITTFNENCQSDLESNEQLFLVLNIISVMAIVISALGILNNISIGFIQRKKSMVVLNSVGMSTAQRTGMLIIESLLTTLWPALIIYCFAPMNMQMASKLMSLMMQMEIPVVFSTQMMPKLIIMALVIMLLATLPIIKQNYKFRIVEELKYE